jgi:hypothetical protein
MNGQLSFEWRHDDGTYAVLMVDGVQVEGSKVYPDKFSTHAMFEIRLHEHVMRKLLRQWLGMSTYGS